MTNAHRDIPAEQVRAVIDRLVTEGVAIAGSSGEEHALFPVAISSEEGAALRQWVWRENAVRTIEVGLGYGLSALYICEALVEMGVSYARHVAIDPFQSSRFGDCALQFLADAGVRSIVEHQDVPSQIALPQLLAAGCSFDLAFVDGNHRFDAVFVDLYYLGRLVRPGGVIILDDYQLPGIRRAAAFWRRNVGWTVEEESDGDTRHEWAVLRTPTTPDERPFEYFVDF